MSKGLETGCEVMKPIPNMSNEDWKEHHLPIRMRLEIANVPRHKGAKKLVRNFALIVGRVYGYVQRVPSQNRKYTSVLIIACSSRSQIRLSQFLKFLVFSWIGECMLVNQFHEFNKGQSDVHSKTFSIKASPHNLRISNSCDEKDNSVIGKDEIKHNTTVQSFDKSWASVVNYFDFVEALERSESESYSTNSEDLSESSREFREMAKKSESKRVLLATNPKKQKLQTKQSTNTSNPDQQTTNITQVAPVNLTLQRRSGFITTAMEVAMILKDVEVGVGLAEQQLDGVQLFGSDIDVVVDALMGFEGDREAKINYACGVLGSSIAHNVKQGIVRWIFNTLLEYDSKA